VQWEKRAVEDTVGKRTACSDLLPGTISEPRATARPPLIALICNLPASVAAAATQAGADLLASVTASAAHAASIGVGAAWVMATEGPFFSNRRWQC
jgi:hypothetical protein